MDRTAIHESGHMVADLIYKVPFQYAHLDDNGVSGCVHDLPEPKTAEQRIERAVCGLAGKVAEGIGAHEPTPLGFCKDWDAVCEYVRLAGVPVSEFDWAIVECVVLAHKLLTGAWAAVTDISGKLWAERVILYADAKAVFVRHCPRRPDPWGGWLGDNLEKALALGGVHARSLWLKYPDLATNPVTFQRYKSMRLTAAKYRRGGR